MFCSVLSQHAGWCWTDDAESCRIWASIGLHWHFPVSESLTLVCLSSSISESTILFTERNSCACISSSSWTYSNGDIGSLGFVPVGGLRACPTSFIMPLPFEQRKLYCSGVIPRALSSLACHLAANCWSKRDKSCSPPLHALIALRGREG